MAAHQQFRELAVTVGDGIENPVVFGKRLTWPIGRGGKLDAVHAHQLIQLAAEHLGQGAIAAALNDSIVKVEIAFLLVIADAGLNAASRSWVSSTRRSSSMSSTLMRSAARRQAMPSRDSRIS